MPKNQKSFLNHLNKHRCKTKKTFYQQWQENPVYCPALEKEVHATRDGWRHISGLGKKRSIQDTHRRLDLFKYARSIVERSGTFQYVRSINREIYYSFESVEKFSGIFEKVGS